MWLLDVGTLELSEFVGSGIPSYAILSHRWESDEVSFVEMKKPKYRHSIQDKKGFHKIQQFCTRAQKDGYAWAWVDCCCIDKRSSAELSEAINSMFQWYRRSGCCYVYLSDVPSGRESLERLASSVWFTRGWTLQELLAPHSIVFLAQDWLPIGYKANQRRHSPLRVPGVRVEAGQIHEPPSPVDLDLADTLSTITNIPADFLVGSKGLGQACIAQRMFWASRRVTKREEDRAYSLMGLFDVNIPVLYGEGLEKAFTRLQREIMSKSPDQSILLWHRTEATSYRLLAESPDCFRNSGTVAPLAGQAWLSSPLEEHVGWSSSTMTNLGLRITLPIRKLETREGPEGAEWSRGDHAEAPLPYVSHDRLGRPQRVSLHLRLLQKGSEGVPIFICHRPRQWTFSSGEGQPTGIFLCGNDYKVGVNPPDMPDMPDMSDSPGDDESLRGVLVKTMASELGVGVADVMAASDLRDLGMDSLVVTVIAAVLREKTGLDLPRNLFVDHSTLDALEGCLVRMSHPQEPSEEVS